MAFTASKASLGDGSGLFSGASPSFDTGGATGSPDGGIWGGLKQGAKGALDIVGQALPIWTRNELQEQTGDQLRQPTFDRRGARQRVGGGQITATGNGGGQFVQGVSNTTLMLGAAAVIGAVILARSG